MKLNVHPAYDGQWAAVRRHVSAPTERTASVCLGGGWVKFSPTANHVDYLYGPGTTSCQVYR